MMSSRASPKTASDAGTDADDTIDARRGFHHGNLRQALLEAALASPDIEGLSLRQLAVGLGVTPAAVYRHFSSREALLGEVARIGFERLERAFAAAFEIGQPPADADDARGRLARLALAYLCFADDEPALWRLMFGAQAADYRDGARPVDRHNSYDYLPAALLGLHRTGVVACEPDERDALFAWSAVHGAAVLRAGKVRAALGPVADVADAVAERVVRSLG
jgi:AcrR family transcriptional regulator